MCRSVVSLLPRMIHEVPALPLWKMIGGSNNIEQHGQFNGNSVQLSTAPVVTARKDIFQSGDDNRRKIVRCFLFAT